MKLLTWMSAVLCDTTDADVVSFNNILVFVDLFIFLFLFLIFNFLFFFGFFMCCRGSPMTSPTSKPLDEVIAVAGEVHVD